MKIKEFFKKIIVMFIIIMIILGNLASNIRAAEEKYNLDEEKLTNILLQDYTSEAHIKDLKDRITEYEITDEMAKQMSEDAVDSIINQDGQKIIDEYNKLWEEGSNEADNVSRSENALKNALLNVLDDNIYVLNEVDTIVAYANIAAEVGGTNSDSTSTDTTSADTTSAETASTDTTSEDSTDSGGGVLGAIGDGLSTLLNGIAGVAFYIVKLLPMAIARAVMGILGYVAAGSNVISTQLSLDQILFNDVPILGINFFEKATGKDANTINEIRNQVSIWYVGIRNLAAVILAVMALYIGIRMAISSVAEEKARYKRMFVDWLVSLVLLFVLHFIMIFIININNGIIEILKQARDNTVSGSTATLMDEAYNEAMAFNLSTISSFTKQFAYMGIYVMLVIMTFIFFISNIFIRQDGRWKIPSIEYMV